MTIKEGYPILFMLDEFANIGIIPSIANITATARSRKIGLSLGLQGVEQLKEIMEMKTHQIFSIT